MQSTDSFVDEIYSLIYTKSVESILSLVPRHKGLRIALIVETSNAESGSVEKYWGYFFCFILFCIFAL